MITEAHMGDSDSNKVLLPACIVSFFCGIFFGYKLKAWRIEWLKRRRERLASKLLETQKEIELLSKSV